MTYPDFFDTYRDQIDTALKSTITRFSVSDSRLAEAILYSTVLGGKRIRPILTLTTASCFGLSHRSAIDAACAVELIHAYSLVHDDLPAMDDDELRRGQPTCHIAFDEATAILTGDALQTIAFELLAQEHDFKPENQLRMIRILAAASGAKGMVLGQAIDLESVGKPLSLDQLENMHRHKTGALIEASIIMGALCSSHTVNENNIEALKKYGQALGLAFQVQDDILDITSDTSVLGKPQGSDLAQNKPTYPSILGLEGAKEKLIKLHQEANMALESIAEHDTSKLSMISDFIINRTQ